MSVNHVLIVEDEEALRTVYGDIFEMHGWRVSMAENGPQALSQLSNPPVPDLILLDLHLPLGSGIEVLHKIRAENMLNNTRVVVISADAVRLAEAAPLAHSTILKPVELHKLIALMA